MDDFEKLLADNLPQLERFIKFRIGSLADAEDIIQDVCLTAHLKIGSLKNEASFKAWLINIARNKCTDYFRRKSRHIEVPLDAVTTRAAGASLRGRGVSEAVREAMEALDWRDRRILELYYFMELSQNEIAELLKIPVGTVKSRLFYAKNSFREKYPYPPRAKGEKKMKSFPEILPAYTIVKSDKPPFPVRWEELVGWFVVPREGEKRSWAMYDFPKRNRTEVCETSVTGRAEVHGVEGVEITAVEHEPAEFNSYGSDNTVERRFVAQLTDTHCRVLAESHMENGVRKCYTFLDGDEFLDNWGFGEDNCGKEINVAPKGFITREDNLITTDGGNFLVDITGRYTVKILGKSYDTVCITDCYTYNDGVVSVQYVDKNGRTVLWRRYNKDNWEFERYHALWSELLPENERLTVNGETYVHWYDCITDYILP